VATPEPATKSRRDRHRPPKVDGPDPATVSEPRPSRPVVPRSKGKVLKYARKAGFRGRSANNFVLARKRVYKALTNATRDRHAKRWEFRANWIQVRPDSRLTRDQRADIAPKTRPHRPRRPLRLAPRPFSSPPPRPPGPSVQRMNAAARQHGLAYSRMQFALRRDNIQLDRKVLSELAVTEPLSFRAIVQRCQGVVAEARAEEREAGGAERATPGDLKELLLSRRPELTDAQRQYLRDLAMGKA